MYTIKFIEYWNGSFGGTETNITPDDIRIKDIDIDPIKFVGNDFFMREPRRCKLILMDNDDNFLLKNFIYNIDDESYVDTLNIVLFYDEDGAIISTSGIEQEVWELWQIGDEPLDNGQIIEDKEIIIQQISKIVVEVYNDTELQYTGLIDKASCSYDLEYVSIECVDFLWIFKTCAEQFIKTIDGKEYNVISSFSVIMELLDKIKDITKININYTPDIDDPTSWYELLNVSSIQSYEDVYMGTSTFSYLVSQGYTPWYVSSSAWNDINKSSGFSYNTIINIVAPVDYYSFLILEDGIPKVISYQAGFRVAYGTSGGLNGVKAQIKIICQKYTFDGHKEYFISNKEITEILPGSHELIYETYIRGAIINYIKNFKDSGNFDVYDAYMETIESIQYCYYITKNIIYGLNRFTYTQGTQDYYSAFIPFFKDTYKYLDIIKVILFLNNITIYSSEDGTIIFANRDFNFAENSTIISVDRRYMLKPFTISATEKDDTEMEILENIYYSEDKKDMYVGPNGEFLDTYMKQVYQTIFNRIPTEISFKLIKTDIDGNDFDVTPQCLLQTTDDLGNELNVVVTQYGLDKNNYAFDIKGYIYKGPVG